jgi:psp operon transcriptional activator
VANDATKWRAWPFLGILFRMREPLGQSDAFLAFVEHLSRVATVDRPVLVVGERGTGKELAASKIHYLSPRWEAPLVAMNCAALSPSLIEDELFGHERGAFTGASAERVGRFEAADGGTLFLDEIGLIPIETQEKILRVVEYGRFERVGSSQERSVNVRIVGATNADLPALVREGRFKADLLDRLAFEVVRVPPLCERRDDILLLARHFAAQMARELGREALPEFSDEVEEALVRHAWPGNVRELKNVIERAVYRSDAALIRELVFDPFASTAPAGPASERVLPVAESSDGAAVHAGGATSIGILSQAGTLPEAIAAVEIAMLQQALAASHYHQRRAAERLGITYHQFRGLYRKHAEAISLRRS